MKPSKPQEAEAFTQNYPTYSVQELMLLENELKPYRIEKQSTYDRSRKVQYVPVDGLNKFYCDKGVTDSKGVITDLSAFLKLDNKMEQYQNWKRKKEYAIKMETLELEKLETHFINF